MTKFKVHRSPHTATHKHKRVKVVLADGTTFIDRFMDRTPKWVFFKERGKMRRGDIKAFTVYKGE